VDHRTPTLRRFLYREPFEFRPVGKVWIGVNSRPRISGVDHGIWPRIRLIPCNITIPDDEQDRQLDTKLIAEAPGILRWAVEGCLGYQRDGLQPPKTVVTATGGWREESNPVARFVEDCCQRGDNLRATVASLYAEYESWAREQGEDPLTKRTFGLRLDALGFRPTRDKRVRRRRDGPSAPG
jgi:putative DNA primase/helicase